MRAFLIAFGFVFLCIGAIMWVWQIGIWNPDNNDRTIYINGEQYEHHNKLLREFLYGRDQYFHAKHSVFRARIYEFSGSSASIDAFENVFSGSKFSNLFKVLPSIKDAPRVKRSVADQTITVLIGREQDFKGTYIWRLATGMPRFFNVFELGPSIVTQLGEPWSYERYKEETTERFEETTLNFTCSMFSMRHIDVATKTDFTRGAVIFTEDTNEAETCISALTFEYLGLRGLAIKTTQGSKVDYPKLIKNFNEIPFGTISIHSVVEDDV